MANQPESKLSRNIQRAWRLRGVYCFKVHGNEYTQAGTPDIVGCYRGFFVWCETKMPGNGATRIQLYRHRQITQAGGIGAVCYSVQDAMRVLDSVDHVWEGMQP